MSATAEAIATSPDTGLTSAWNEVRTTAAGTRSMAVAMTTTDAMIEIGMTEIGMSEIASGGGNQAGIIDLCRAFTAIRGRGHGPPAPNY